MIDSGIFIKLLNCAVKSPCDRRPLERIGGDEDVNPGLEGGKRPLSPELHLHVDQEVPGTLDLAVQVHGARVGVELAGAEVVLLVPLGDADDHVVAGVCGGGADAEDLGGDDDVGLEAEVVVGDSQGRVLALQVVGAADPLTARVGDFAVVRWAAEGEATVAPLDVVAGLSQRAVVGPGGALVDISAGASVRRHGVSVIGTRALVTAGNVYALIGAKMADALRALVNIFAGAPVLPQVVSLPAVALVRPVDVGALLAARVGQALVHIFTVIAVAG